MFVVYDIETTGFSELNSDVIEFAYIAFDDNNTFIKSEQLYFYYDGMSWSEEAYAVHHISLDFLKTQKDKFRENLLKMYSILNHNNVVGYNNNHFDNPFVKTWLMRMGIRNLEFKISQDLMVCFRPFYHKARIKLVKLAEMCGITPDTVNRYLPMYFPEIKNSHAHEAAYDVVMTALLCFIGMSKKLVTFKPLIATSVEELDDSLISDMSTSQSQATRSAVAFSIRTKDDDFGDMPDNHERKLFYFDDPKITSRGPLRIDVKDCLVEVDTDCYQLDGRGISLYYTEIKGETPCLYIITGGTKITIDNLDMETFVKDYFN